MSLCLFTTLLSKRSMELWAPDEADGLEFVQSRREEGGKKEQRNVAVFRPKNIHPTLIPVDSLLKLHFLPTSSLCSAAPQGFLSVEGEEKGRMSPLMRAQPYITAVLQ